MEKQGELLTLKMVAEGTSSVVGKDFLRQLVKCLAETVGIHGAWVTEFLAQEQRLRALAFWINGEFVEHYEYSIKDTPCQPVLEYPTDIYHVPEKIIQLYPGDNDLPRLGAVSYMGIALLGMQGQILGHLAILDNKPMLKQPRITNTFKIFAARAAAELQRLQTEKQLLESERRLHRLINGTNDAIVEVDDHLCITQVNSAAVKLFGLTAPATTYSLKDVLTSDGLKKVIQAITQVRGQTNDSSYYWLQGYVYCLKTAGEVVPAEATVTESLFQNKVYYILTLRDVRHKLEAEEKLKTLRMETELLREEIRKVYNLSEIIGSSTGMMQAMNAVRLVAPTTATVLLTGETGTGKELFARAIHNSSSQKDKPMVKVNCAALPASLIESELFGHEKGAFTGAQTRREGRFALAHNSTIFLDEVGELPLELQAKLLRVLQEGEFEPVGSNKTVKVNVRVIAATNKNLLEEVKKGNFREDLYYRLHVYPIHIPPLRERGKDIILLAETYLQHYGRQMHKRLPQLTETDKQALLAYTWPGNVRELQNVMERAVITYEEGNLNFNIQDTRNVSLSVAVHTPEKIITTEEWKVLEKENILKALKAAHWKIAGPQGAAALLQLPPTTLSSKLKVLGINKLPYTLHG